MPTEYTKEQRSEKKMTQRWKQRQYEVWRTKLTSCVRHVRNKKMASKSNTCKVADLEFDSFGRRYEDLCIKDHVRSSINNFWKELEQLLTPVSR